MSMLWYFGLAVAACIALLMWLEHRDRKVLREHLSKRYPVRLTNSFWGNLYSADGPGREPGRDDRRDDRRDRPADDDDR
jgi:hypothetical protein